MKLNAADLTQFLTENDLPERVEAATEKWAADGHPLAVVLPEALFHGAEAMCPCCYADARDFLLHVPQSDATELLAWADLQMEEIWVEWWRMYESGRASPASYVAKRRAEADEIIEALRTDALLFPGDRDLTAASVSSALRLSLRRGVGSAYWCRARSVLELAGHDELAVAIPKTEMEVRSLVMLLHSARRLCRGPWWRALFPIRNAYDYFRRLDTKRLERRFVSGAGVDADPG